MTFTQSPSNPNIYQYENTAYFLINKKGFGNYYDNKNFHFTTEIKARFVYRGGEVFTFTGDDDLWVFIGNFKFRNSISHILLDGKLVIDLGGVHAALSSTWNADTANLTIGRSYPFTIFHAERHTTESNFKAYTSLDLYCPWYDFCGVCQGDGKRYLIQKSNLIKKLLYLL